MALSCSTQLLQRSWLVYFRQGTWCLRSRAANASFRSRAFISSSSVLSSHSRLSQISVPVWRQQHRSSSLGFQSVRALSASSLETAPQGSGSPALAEADADQASKDLQEDEKVTSVSAAVDEYVDSSLEEQIDSAVSGAQEEKVQEAIQASGIAQEEMIDAAVNAVQEEDVQEALNTIDLLNDEGPSELAESEAEELVDRHPWPEWDKYLTMLESGGHFVFDTETTDRRPVIRQEDDSGKIKRASMAFARNRDDVIKYASTVNFF